MLFRSRLLEGYPVLPTVGRGLLDIPLEVAEVRHRHGLSLSAIVCYVQPVCPGPRTIGMGTENICIGAEMLRIGSETIAIGAETIAIG